MKTIRRVADLGAVLVVLGLLASCGAELTSPKSGVEAAPAPGIPGTAAAPAEEGEAEPATLADAEALLEKARLDLDRLALNEPAAPPPAAAGAAAPSMPRAQTAPPSPAPERDESRRVDKSASASDGAALPPAKEMNPCETACKAFSSLTRASDAVCRLDADGGKRCERARQIREDASHRVASCGCSK